MSRPGGKGTTPVPVTIFGQTYTLRTEEDPRHIEELAEYVDGRMREVADLTRTADTGKIAVLAALNIADDLRRKPAAAAAAAPAAKKPNDWVRRAARIEAMLDEALA